VKALALLLLGLPALALAESSGRALNTGTPVQPAQVSDLRKLLPE
jgi:hypothetical protein